MKICNDFVKIEYEDLNGKVRTIEKRNFMTDLYIKRYKNYIIQKMLATTEPIAEMNKLFITNVSQTVTTTSQSITNVNGVIDSQFVFGAELDSDILYNENYLTITHRYTVTFDGSFSALFGVPIFGIGFGDVNYFGTNDYLYAWLELLEFNIIPYNGMTFNVVRQDTYYLGGTTEETVPYHLSQYGISGKYGYLDSISLGYDVPDVSMTNIVITNTIADEVTFTGDLYLNSSGVPYYPSEDLYPFDDLYPSDQIYTKLFQRYRIYNGVTDTGLFYYVKNNIKQLDATFNNEKVTLKIKYERSV